MTNKSEKYFNLSISAFTEKQIEKIHNTSLLILEQAGINVHSNKCRDLLKGAGATVQNELRVHIPSKLVESALQTASSGIDIYNRDGEKAMVLKGRNSYFGTGSDLKYNFSMDKFERIESCLENVALAARLCDRLPNIDFVMSYALPNDVPSSSIEIEQLRMMMDNTKKPIIMTQFSGLEMAEKIHKHACEYCGDEKLFKKKPNYIIYGQFVSPLQHDSDALNRLSFCADKGIPVIYVPTIMIGASGPITLAGSIALANAECLAGLVMHQLIAPGAPFIYGGCVSPLDMKTTVFAYGSPEWRIADVALSQLSLHYNLPVFGTAGATDSKVIDAQAGAEWAYSLICAALAGVNIIHDVGYMESGLTGSLEAISICDEIIGIVKKTTSGFEISEETLALDTIKRVGPAGHFMEEEETLNRFLSDVWYPSLFERDRFEPWESRGCKDVLQRARERVKELLG